MVNMQHINTTDSTKAKELNPKNRNWKKEYLSHGGLRSEQQGPTIAWEWLSEWVSEGGAKVERLWEGGAKVERDWEGGAKLERERDWLRVFRVFTGLRSDQLWALESLRVSELESEWVSEWVWGWLSEGGASKVLSVWKFGLFEQRAERGLYIFQISSF